MRNTPSLAAIVADPDLLKGYNLADLADLIDFADATKKEAEAAAKLLRGFVLDRNAVAIKAAYDAKGSDTGTVHVFAGGFDLEVNTPKKVEWDQDKLAAACAKIAAAGDNPGEYVKIERKVEEKAFTAWPSLLKRQFADARTLTPGTPTLKIAAASEQAAA